MSDADKTQPDESQPVDPDVQKCQELYDLMLAESLESVELQKGDVRIKLQRARKPGPHDNHHHRSTDHSPVAHSSSPAPSSKSEEEVAPNGSVIATPLAGVFYRSPSPSTPPYVQEGTVVDIGQTLCIVEAMKVMNEIKAENRCRITRIKAENARPVVAGQTLFDVEPA